jgi:hypothetical protein
MDEEGNVVRVEEDFDATQLDVEHTRVGNTLGALAPTGSVELDNNGDGLMDLAVYYAVADARPLVEAVIPVQYGEIWVAEQLNPVGLHYRSAGGVDYLIYDIFELGQPVTLGTGAGGAAGVGGEAHGPGLIPEVTALHSVRPNPFTAATTIRFGLAAEEHVTLSVYDARGMLIRALEDRVLQAGLHQCVWDGRTSDGAPVAAGVYFARFSAGSFRATQKVMLLR